MRRRRKTEGVVGQLAFDRGRAALREVLDPLMQGERAVQAGEDLIERSRPARRVFVVSQAEDKRKPCDLSGAFVDRPLDAVFSGDDLAFQAHASVGAGFEMLEPVRGCEVFKQAGDEEARDFAELGRGVQGEQDAQEGQQQLEHGAHYNARSEAGGIWRALSPIFDR